MKQQRESGWPGIGLCNVVACPAPSHENMPFAFFPCLLRQHHPWSHSASVKQNILRLSELAPYSLARGVDVDVWNAVNQLHRRTWGQLDMLMKGKKNILLESYFNVKKKKSICSETKATIGTTGARTMREQWLFIQTITSHFKREEPVLRRKFI